MKYGTLLRNLRLFVACRKWNASGSNHFCFELGCLEFLASIEPPILKTGYQEDW
jgi:hypothetical protein